MSTATAGQLADAILAHHRRGLELSAAIRAYAEGVAATDPDHAVAVLEMHAKALSQGRCLEQLAELLIDYSAKESA